MTKIQKQITPIGSLFALLTKKYISVYSDKLSSLPIDRYYYAFWVISENDGEITSKRLAEILHTDKVLVVRILKHLTDNKFIERIQHPNDKRSFLLHVTETGKKYVSAVEKAIKETDQEFIAYVNPENKEVFLSELTSLSNKVEPINCERILLDYKNLKKFK
ncbi:MarR family transcriptional regulator [Brumimicrobium glaciale]|jgi:DNA-binding MarR family transcriptional regulator|uniref:MarR family transcriptional regulator n=1 Tax=Brumimicrobium glaciale TaxID=200475 RepID=A0A4Q4KSS8_9FLAO|nr:MarR family transcriptional regulator [Brumimicrobium glaciale]RYM35119.1 MarR family transcriptional regulator [Brumimicrobium glaciale]